MNASRAVSSTSVLRAGFGLVASLASLVALGAADAPAGGEAAPLLVPETMFEVPEGLEITVWAMAPRFNNPTNIDIDAAGRVWVAEGVNYRSKWQRRPEGDRIVVLQDSDGDGKADKEHVFVQEPFLISPLGVAVIDNQVVVSQPPDLIVYTDADRDLVFDAAKGDKREVLLTGFYGRNHDHSLHSVTAGPDGQWYFNQGNCGALFTDKSGKTFRIGSHYVPQLAGQEPVEPQKISGEKSDDGHVWVGGFAVRMNPDGTNANIIAHNFRNSYEQAVTSLGDIFQSDNDDPPACRVAAMLEYGNAGFTSRDGKRSWQADRRPGQSIPTAHWRSEDPGTMPPGDVYGGGSPTGVAFYENGALGASWSGLLLACEPGRNVIFGYKPKPAGAGFALERFDFLTSNKERKFAGSDFTGGKPDSELHTRFRPSDVAVGADGALYVADWFDPRVGGHQTLDDSQVGVIYRIAPKGFKPTNPTFDLATTEGQIAALKSPAVNVRNSGFTRLKAQGEKAVPALSALAADADPYLAARAVWLLAQLGPAGVAKVAPLLESKDDTVRLVAFRALRRANHEVLAMAKRMAGDASPAVRREVALSMRDLPAADSLEVLTTVAKGFDGKDRAYLEALALGGEGREAELYAALAPIMGGPAEAWSEPFAWLAWRLGAPASVDDLKKRAKSTKISAPQRKQMVDALAFVPTAEAATAMLDLARSKTFPLRGQALWWLFNRKDTLWKEHGLLAAMKENGLYDPDKVTVQAMLIPEPPPGPSKLPPVADIVKLEGDATRGQAATAFCMSCHQIGKSGADFGPDLTMFGRTQPTEVIVNALVNPSGDIAHGYEGSQLTTHDGIVVHGIVLATGDPVIIKSMGGIVQTIPKSKIKSLEKLKRSLMFNPEMMGVTAQSAADIAAYLRKIGSETN